MRVTSPGLMKAAGSMARAGLEPMAWLISVAGSKDDAEDLLHEAGGGLLEGGDAVVGVAAVFDLVRLALEHVAHQRIGHVVVFADAEVEQPAFRVGGQGGALGPLDLLELVDLVALAVVGAADAVGEQRLEPGVGRCGHGSLRFQGSGRLVWCIVLGKRPRRDRRSPSAADSCILAGPSPPAREPGVSHPCTAPCSPRRRSPSCWRSR